MNMEDLLDMVVNDESPSQISDQIKNIIFAKAAERVDSFRSDVASNVFTENKTQGPTIYIFLHFLFNQMF